MPRFFPDLIVQCSGQPVIINQFVWSSRHRTSRPTGRQQETVKTALQSFARGKTVRRHKIESGHYNVLGIIIYSIPLAG